MRDRAVLAGAESRLPDDTPPEGSDWYICFYWGVRSFVNSPHDPITLSLINDYQDQAGVLLDRNDVDIICKMDRAFREQYPKTIAAHEKIKGNANGGR